MSDIVCVEWPYYYQEAGLDRETIRSMVKKASSVGDVMQRVYPGIKSKLKKDDPTLLTDIFKHQSCSFAGDLNELSKLASGQTIDNLLILGHGEPGNISVGDGVGGGGIDKYIALTNISTWQAALKSAQGSFTPDSIILLAGCNVGTKRDDSSGDLLAEAAVFFKCAVAAPTAEIPGSFDTGCRNAISRGLSPRGTRAVRWDKDQGKVIALG